MTVTGTVRRPNLDINQPLVVQLRSQDTSEVTMPAQVTIPAGQSSATFSVTSVDDSLLDGTIAVALTASATGYVDGTTTLNVTDVESLLLSVVASQISENGSTAEVSLQRSNTDVDSELVVNLTSSLPDRLSVPSTVTIPVGQRSTTFVITAIDDQLLAPAVIAQILASAAKYTSASLDITITDYETLIVSFDNATVMENGALFLDE